MAQRGKPAEALHPPITTKTLSRGKVPRTPELRDKADVSRLSVFLGLIVLGLLEAQGYIERTVASHNGYTWWRTTIFGNALAMSSFGRPISRKTVERLVAEMLERARLYNSDHTKPYYVQRLRIFGSYLDKTIDPLGDVDVELVIGHRLTDPQPLLQYAADSGRTFPTFMDQLMWPQKEIVQTLRNRSAAVNITLEDIELIPDRVETFYEAGPTR